MSVTKVTGMMQTSTKGGDISSASPTVIDTDGDYFDVTGTTNFAAFTVVAGRRFTIQFDGALTMTHHATNLDLPGGANITTAAGDVAEFFATGTNTVQCVNYTKADGTAVVAAAGGKVLQCLSTTKTDSATTTSTSFVDTGLQVIITPAATSSKIMIWVNIVIGRQTNSKRLHFQLTGGNTASYVGDAGTGHETAFSEVIRAGDEYAIMTMSGSYLDAPSSTSAITYKLQWKGEADSMYLNRPYTLDSNGANCASTITAMEIGA
jgi:hypothetical protein